MKKNCKKVGILFFLILFLSCTSLGNVQKDYYEEKMETADNACNNGDYITALKLYENLLEDVKLRNKYVRAVVLFRIAFVQKETGDLEGLKKTVSKLEKLKTYTLPYYYNKKIEDLLLFTKTGADNIGITAVPGKTIIPENTIIYTVYISSRGSDNAEGTKNSPLKTFEAAQKKIREKRKSVTLGEGSLQIVFVDDYNIEKPFILTAEDSGTEKNPLVISGSAEKKVVISGGKNITTWRKVNPSDTNAPIEEYKNKIIVAEFEKNNIAGFGTLIFAGFSSGRGFKTFGIPELFYKEEVQKISSWPNEGYTKIEINERFNNDRIIKWANEKEAWLHGYWKYEWAEAYEKINNIDVEKRIISLEAPVNRYGFGRNDGRIVNAVSEIDLPGEWAIDTEKGLIFYYPLENIDPKNIFISYSTGAFEIDNCNNLKIENLEIKQIRGDILNIKDSENIVIYNNELNNASGYGIIINGKTNHIIHSTVFKSFGRGGIEIDTGDRKKLIDSKTIIENCSFSDLSRIDRTYTPGILIYGMSQIIKNNVFFNIPSSAIRLETNNVIVELNEFYNCVFESGDQGAVETYANPLYLGNIIRWNYFHDIVNKEYMAASVRLDDFISGFTVYENVFENGSSGRFGAVQVHGGKNNLVEGNIFNNCDLVFSITTKGKRKWQKGAHVIENLASHDWKTTEWQNQYPYLSGIENKYTDENYYFDNIIINSSRIKSGDFNASVFFNNIAINKSNNVVYSDIIKYLPKYRRIPIDKIGNYKN
ncbi:MAG: right-handed parallel beta-helix repeat-containing protein [Spirochaetaceae bacterium]|nr:right-handed parallel beta-helix repeat-containing protein [Spirochaetaceae bacterium]